MGVREGLLVLLDSGPRHGYGLKSAFEQATGGVWPLNVGQVYTTLERLERDGLVAPDADDDGQRSWRLTERGREELGEWWWTVPGEEPPPRDELVLKVLLAIATGRRDHALDVIGHQRDALFALLAQRRQQTLASRRDGDDSLAAAVMLDVLVLRAEADLRWLDACEERVIRSVDADDTDQRRAARRRRPRAREKRS